MYPRKIIVNVPEKQSKPNKAPLIISIISLCFAFGTFAFNYWDAQKIRTQSRNDFYSKEASYLKIEPFDTIVKPYSFRGVVSNEMFGDTVGLAPKFRISNISNQRCEIVSYFLFDKYKVLKVGSQPYISSLPDVLSKDSNIFYSIDKYQQILPNEYFIADPVIDFVIDEYHAPRINFLIVYKNSIGGMYAIQYEGLIKTFPTDTNYSEYNFVIKPLENYFRIFKENEFLAVNEKFEMLRQDNYLAHSHANMFFKSLDYDKRRIKK